MGTTRKNRRYELPEEVLAVLECSPNLSPCEKFRHADIYAFAKHLNERKCQLCIAFFQQLNKEQGMIQFLRDNKN